MAMNAAAFSGLRAGRVAKGDVGAVARLAGIGGAKRTAELIPLCHAVPLEHVGVELSFEPRGRRVVVTATAKTSWTTGVEMEALVAVMGAVLAIYDRAEAIERGLTIGPVRLGRE